MESGFLTPEEEAQLNRAGSPQASDGSGFDDGFEFDTDGIDPADQERGGFIDKEGQYHFEISDVKFDVSKQKQTPYVEFCLTVLHSVKGQSPEGSRFNHQSYLSKGARGMTSGFGHRIGALKMIPTGKVDEKGQPKHIYVDPKTNTKRVTKDTWQAVKGSQFIGTVKMGKAREDNGKTYEPRLELQISKCWQVDAQEVADVPKNLQAMKLIGKTSAKPPAASQAAAKETKAPPEKPPKAPPTSAPAVPDDLSDL